MLTAKAGFYKKFSPNTSGAVAQLGERLNGIQEARSSILLSSTRYFLRTYDENRESFFWPYVHRYVQLY